MAGGPLSPADRRLALVQDLVSIVMLSLPCGWLCTTIGLPTMFGYIICGVLLGPSGLNSIKVRTESAVQDLLSLNRGRWPFLIKLIRDVL